MVDLKGRHVFIAGGSRGIGAATARLAGRFGAAVSVNYLRDEEAARRVVEEIEAVGGRAVAVQGDVSDEVETRHAVDAAAEALGPIHGLVVCAGVFEGLPLEEMTVEFWDRVMAVNVRGTYLSVQAAARHMPEGGSVVIVTSTAGQRGSAVFSAYATSKGAQILFMRSMAKELAPRGIRVNCVAPAWTETDMAKESLDALGREAVSKDFALGRIGLPEDVAKGICFLLSDLAGFVTGSTVTVDGGMDMRG